MLTFLTTSAWQQLQQVSGVAAILRYPLPDLDELEEIAAAQEEYLSDDEEEVTEEVRKQREEARLREDMEDMGFAWRSKRKLVTKK